MDKRQYIKAYVEKAEDDGSLQVAIASDETPDREGEIVKADGWDLKAFKKNPVLLWSHNAGFGEQRPPIGKVTQIRQEGKRTLFKPVFDMADEFAAEIHRKFKDGFLNAFSVGFIPLERDEKNNMVIKSAELLEISAVNVPANPKALVALRSAGMPVAKTFEDWTKGVVDYPVETSKNGAIDDSGSNTFKYNADINELEIVSLPTKEEETKDLEEPDEKGAIGAHTTETAPDTQAWSGSDAIKTLRKWASKDGSGDLDQMNWGKYKRGFTWYDQENPEKFESYKLPHHIVNESGMQVVFRGVAAAMGVLLGARGGIDIPEDQRKGVHNHLRRHYTQFDREAPEFKLVEDQILKDFDIENVTDYILIENKQALDIEAITKAVKEAMPKEPIKEAIKEINKKTADTFTDEDLRDSLVIADKSIELAFKKIKRLKGGE